ncbi:hypothetical protein ACN47E_001913 [Coniothyrium glycines]
MRTSPVSLFLFLGTAVGRLFKDDAYLVESTSIGVAGPASAIRSELPIATTAPGLANVELRQVPNVAIIAPRVPGIDPNVPVIVPDVDAINPVPRPAAVQAELAVPAAAPPMTTTSIVLPDSQDFVSVQWVETKIGGTSRTWVPLTVTFHFEPFLDPAPLPGKGEIGMGTLTGKTGQTQTIVMGAGAAPTDTAVWLKGVAAAVGVGLAGLVV